MKLRPWVKNTFTVLVLGAVAGVSMILTLPKALDQMYYEQYEKPMEYYKEIDQQRLDTILEDSIIDESEKADYEELTGQK